MSGVSAPLEADFMISTPTHSNTAYERVLDQLRTQGKKVRESVAQAAAQCPAHDDRHQSLAVYRKLGKAKIVCFAGCSDVLDVLPALNMGVRDLYDQPGKTVADSRRFPDPAVMARLEVRRAMTPPQRALDDLLQLPDLGLRLALGAARIRPELYIWEREQLDGELS